MADLVKKIKIKKQDGTFTDYIPIGAEAQNVDVDGESVAYKLNKKPYYYDTIADMKADTKLKVGDMAVTLGYYTIENGGGAEYKITNDVGYEEEYYETLNNGLYAKLIIKENANVKQFGAYGDGIHDDTVAINTAIINAKVLFIPNGTYMIDPGHETLIDHDTDIRYGIKLQSNRIINFDENALLKAKTNNYYYYRVIELISVSNVVINNGKVQAEKNTHTGSMDSEYGHCISMVSSHNITINNMELFDAMGDGICVSGLDYGRLQENRSTNIWINNCLIHDCRRQGISIINAYNTKITNCEIYDIRGIAPQSCIDLESNFSNNPVEKVYIDNCNLHDSESFSLVVTAKTKDVFISNSSADKIAIISTSDTLIDNCKTKQIYCESEVAPIINNCIIEQVNLGKNNSKIIVNNSLITWRVYGAWDDEIIENIVLNNCTIDNRDAETPGWTFMTRGSTSIELNNCTIITNGYLFAETATDQIIIKNCLINMLDINKVGFSGKSIVATNNHFIGGTLYWFIKLDADTKNSYIANNTFDTAPRTMIAVTSGVTLNQKIYICNNISDTALVMTNTPDQVNNLIENNNIYENPGSI